MSQCEKIRRTSPPHVTTLAHSSRCRRPHKLPTWGDYPSHRKHRISPLFGRYQAGNKLDVARSQCENLRHTSPHRNLRPPESSSWHPLQCVLGLLFNAFFAVLENNTVLANVFAIAISFRLLPACLGEARRPRALFGRGVAGGEGGWRGGAGGDVCEFLLEWRPYLGQSLHA